MHRGRYWSDESFQALDLIRKAAGKHGIPVAECVFRWLSHHSVLTRERGDAIIIGATRTSQLEETLVALENGPLPEDVVEAVNKASELMNATRQPYAR